MQVDYLIVGQGISGSFLSYYLYQAGKAVLVVDKIDPQSPSRLAAGVINPVTGRRMVTVWRADEVLPFAWKAYQELGSYLGVKGISEKTIIDFFPNPFMKENFRKRAEEGNSFIQNVANPGRFLPYFNYEFGCGEILPAYTAHLENILPAWRNKLHEEGLILEEEFQIEKLNIRESHITWTTHDGRQVQSSKIIFCDGGSGFDNPFFKQLPFALNKGESLVLSIPGLPNNHIYKKSLALVPLDTADHFWIGSNYLWEFEDANPTKQFRQEAEAALREWLKIPYSVLEHRAGIRPATVERRPFVGLHPHQPAVGILNGMGTKGCSLAPFFARQLADHLLTGRPILPEANVHRFQKILSAKTG
jgi:glycine/D-amino acid oxidase-like deaminating enzyme